MKKPNKWSVAPEFHRIPHFNKDISNMTHDDITPNTPVPLPLSCFIQEKIDGANMGISWLNDGPVIRNRENVLRKGYSRIKTPAKRQFTTAWNWIHEHEEDIKIVEEIWQSPITIFGDWMFAQHSLEYDKLPDWFIAYDIWSVEDNKFLSPDIVDKLLSQTKIEYIKPIQLNLETIEDIIQLSERNSDFRSGICEGIVIKTNKKEFLDKTWKVVNKHFTRREDFNSCLIKNKIVSL